MWLLKDIYFHSNGIISDLKFKLMSSYMDLDNVELVFNDGKILKFNPNMAKL